MGFVEEEEPDEPELEEPEEPELEEPEEEEAEEMVEEIEEDESTGHDIDLDALAPNATDVQDAAEEEHRWMMMAWSDKGYGKTHMGYTMPGPVCIIDTENKAGDIAHKFDDKQVKIWHASNFDEAVQYRDEAMNLLSEYKAKTGETGTIVVDSMADLWQYAQQKFIEEWYPNSAPDEVDIELQDWPKIKEIHNNQFRAGLVESDYHLYWTSTRKDDVGAAIRDDLDEAPDKPGGETDNGYKVNSIIKLRLNPNGVPVGDLQKSGLLRFKYIGLKRPTFQKHKEIVEHVEEIESNGAETAQEVEEQFDLDYNVSFTEADTMRYLKS